MSIMEEQQDSVRQLVICLCYLLHSLRSKNSQLSLYTVVRNQSGTGALWV